MNKNIVKTQRHIDGIDLNEVSVSSRGLKNDESVKKKYMYNIFSKIRNRGKKYCVKALNIEHPSNKNQNGKS